MYRMEKLDSNDSADNALEIATVWINDTLVLRSLERIVFKDRTIDSRNSTISVQDVNSRTAVIKPSSIRSPVPSPRILYSFQKESRFLKADP